MAFHMYGPPPTNVETPEDVEAAVRRCLESKMLGVDTETLGAYDKKKYGRNMTDQVVVMSLSPDEASRILVPRRLIHHFEPVLSHKRIPKAVHNIKFDAHRFKNMGVDLGGPWADTLHLDFLADEDLREGRHSLDMCMLDYFDIRMAKYMDLFGKADPRVFRPGHEKWLQYLDYATLDAWSHRKLAIYLFECLSKFYIGEDYTLEDYYWEYDELQIKAVWGMERTGIKLNQEQVKEIETRAKAEVEEAARRLAAEVGRPLNPNSNKDLISYFVEELGYEPSEYTATGQPKVDGAYLTRIAKGKKKGSTAAKYTLEHKKAAKLLSTYVRGYVNLMDADGRIRTRYNTTQRTGRLSSSEPNLQNCPRLENDLYGIRRLFMADPGYKLIVIDYSQLEMRILAHMAGEPSMAEAIRNGLDMHCFVAAQMYGYDYEEMYQKAKVEEIPEFKAMRTDAKAIGFGIVYGKTAFGLAKDFGISKEEAQGRIDKFLDAFPGVRRFMNATIQQAHDVGFVQVITGRPRRLSAISSPDWKESKGAERQAINAPIQGSAAEVVKIAMISIMLDARLTELGYEMQMQVHDELVGQAPEEHVQECARIVQEIMENVFLNPLDVPLTAEPCICDIWADGK